jgi:hypothetical protein
MLVHFADDVVNDDYDNHSMMSNNESIMSHDSECVNMCNINDDYGDDDLSEEEHEVMLLNSMK